MNPTPDEGCLEFILSLIYSEVVIYNIFPPDDLLF